MIRQDDVAFPQEIRDFGCYFMSCMYLAGVKNKKEYDIDEIIAVYRAARLTGIIGPECFVNDPVSLMRVLGIRVQTVLKVDASTACPDGAYEILQFHRDADTPAGMNNAPHDHFVAGDGKGNVANDSLGQSNTVKYGAVKSKRILK